MVERKRCYVCSELLEFEKFILDAGKASGYGSICRSCDRKKSAAYHLAHRKERLSAMAEKRERLVSGRGVRICKTEGCGSPTSLWRRQYCERCREERRRYRSPEAKARHRARVARTSRDYGRAHSMKREQWAGPVATGTIDCARCGMPIAADEPWDLGHDDLDRSRYAGPEHRRCNRATAGRNRKRVSRAW